MDMTNYPKTTYNKMVSLLPLVMLSSSLILVGAFSWRLDSLGDNDHHHVRKDQGQTSDIIWPSNSSDQVPDSVTQKGSLPNKIINRINIGLLISPTDSKNLDLVLERMAYDHLNHWKLNQDSTIDYEVELISATIVENPIEMSQIICKTLIGNNKTGSVSAVIIDTHPQFMDSISAISFTLTLYNIPIIGTTLRDSSILNEHSYVSLIPPNDHQADIWYSLMIELKFERAFVMTSADSNDIVSRFVQLVDNHNQIESRQLKLEAIIEYDPLGFGDYSSVWRYLVNRIKKLLEDSICRVFMIHAQHLEDIQIFLHLIDHFKMASAENREENFVLILSEETIRIAEDNGLRLPTGIIWSQLSGLNDSSMLIRESYTLDALDIVLRSIENTAEIIVEENRKSPLSCQSNLFSEWYTPGTELLLAMRGQQFRGFTGYILFDEDGDRLTANYQLLNLVAEESIEGGNMISKSVTRVIGEFNNGLTFDGIFNTQSQDNLISNDRHQNRIEPNVRLNISSIQWPDKSSGRLNSGLYINRHLSIVTLEEKPFVWTLPEADCSDLQVRENDTTSWRPARIPCKRRSSSSSKLQLEERLCCVGYCMDLLAEISRQINFTYDLYLEPSNEYGHYLEPPVANGRRMISSNDDQPQMSSSKMPQVNLPNLSQQQTNKGQRSEEREENGQSQQKQLKWSGLMGELVARRANMAFAPLTVTAARSQAIDFSKPFKFHGFSILLRRASKHTTLASFLQPFHNQLWLLVIGVATHVVALTLYLLDRYSTFGQFGIERNLIPDGRIQSNRPIGHCTAADHPLHLSSSLWFSWSILLNSGVGEHTPKSLSGRVLGIFWSGFAMIVVASYTANLAAFLMLDSRDSSDSPTLSGIDDPRLRSGDLALNFATVRGSAADAYLQSQVEYVNLYRKMEEFEYRSVDEAIGALRGGQIDALIWDSTRLQWEVAMDERCSLGIAGELFGSSGYAIGLQRNSHWTENVTTKLLELHESGFMIELDRRWLGAGSRGQQQVEGATEDGSSKQQQPNIVDHCERVNSGANNNLEEEDATNSETLSIANIAGVFILFACGLIVSFGLILIERLCYKYKYRGGGLPTGSIGRSSRVAMKTEASSSSQRMV